MKCPISPLCRNLPEYCRGNPPKPKTQNGKVDLIRVADCENFKLVQYPHLTKDKEDEVIAIKKVLLELGDFYDDEIETDL